MVNSLDLDSCESKPDNCLIHSWYPRDNDEYSSSYFSGMSRVVRV